MLNRRSPGRPKAGATEAAQSQADRVEALSQILDVLPDAAAIVDSADRVLAASANCVAMGLISLERIAPVELRALNREVHRLSKTQSRDAVIKRNGSRWTSTSGVENMSDARKCNRGCPCEQSRICTSVASKWAPLAIALMTVGSTSTWLLIGA